MSSWDAGYASGADHHDLGGGGMGVADHAGLVGGHHSGGDWDSGVYGHNSSMSHEVGGHGSQHDDFADFGGAQGGFDGLQGREHYDEMGGAHHVDAAGGGGWDGDLHGGGYGTEGPGGYGHQHQGDGLHGPEGAGGWDDGAYGDYSGAQHYGGHDAGHGHGGDQDGLLGHDEYEDMHGGYGDHAPSGFDHLDSHGQEHSLGHDFGEFGQHSGLDPYGQHGFGGNVHGHEGATGYDLDGGLDHLGGGFGEDYHHGGGLLHGSGTTPQAADWDGEHDQYHTDGLHGHHDQNFHGAGGWDDGHLAGDYGGAESGWTDGLGAGAAGLDGYGGTMGAGALGRGQDRHLHGMGGGLHDSELGNFHHGYGDRALLDQQQHIGSDAGYGQRNAGYQDNALGLENGLAGLSLTEHHHHHDRLGGSGLDGYGHGHEDLGLIDGGSRQYGSSGLGGLYGGSGWGGLDESYDNQYYGGLKTLYHDGHSTDLFGSYGDNNRTVYNDPFTTAIPLDYGHGQISQLSQYGLSRNSWSANDVLALDDMYLFESALQADMDITEADRLKRWQERLRWEASRSWV